MPLTPVTQVDRLKLQVRHVCKLVISKIVSKILRVDGFNKLNIGLVDSEAQVPFIAAFVSLFVSLEPICEPLFHCFCYIRPLPGLQICIWRNREEAKKHYTKGTISCHKWSLHSLGEQEDFGRLSNDVCILLVNMSLFANY